MNKICSPVFLFNGTSSLFELFKVDSSSKTFESARLSFLSLKVINGFSSLLVSSALSPFLLVLFLLELFSKFFREILSESLKNEISLQLKTDFI